MLSCTSPATIALMSESSLVLIDAHALIYRAYFAFPPLTTPEGKLVNAVYGFTRILLTSIEDLSPEYIAVAFDLPKPTFRHTQFAGYKAQRKEMPDDLQPQIEIVKQVVKSLNIPDFSVEGYEADDVIGTLARQASVMNDAGGDPNKVVILTGDRDAFQLVTDDIHVLMPAQGKNPPREFGPSEVKDRMGIRPDQIIDYKALAGDASDNIPGVPGIGDKTACHLLTVFDSVENLYQEIKDQTPRVSDKLILKPNVLKKLSEGYESSVMSKQLATIDQNVPIQLKLEDCRVAGYDKSQAVELFYSLGFKSLQKLLPKDDFENGLQDALF